MRKFPCFSKRMEYSERGVCEVDLSSYGQGTHSLQKVGARDGDAQAMAGV